MNSKRVGIDIAKNSFSLCGVDTNEHIVLEKTLKRKELLSFIANLPACPIAMEAGSGAHHWAREFMKLGHTPYIIAPRFVTPYRRSGKNHKHDARAICEALGRPDMHFVSIKSKVSAI